MVGFIELFEACCQVFIYALLPIRASQVELVEKSSACQCMQVRSLSQEDSPEGGHDNPCLQTFMDRGTWQTMVHKAAKVRHY